MSDSEAEINEAPDDEHDAQSATEAETTSDLRPRLIRAGHVLGVLLLLVIVLPFVLYAVPQVIGAEASYVVTSPSMEPELSPYDVIFVNEVDPASIQEGDVINYQRSSDPSTTTHQVIEVIEQDGAPAFRTMGINNEGPDQGVVTVDEFRGRVMEVGGTSLAIPYVGRIIEFASSGIGFTLLFAIPVTLLVLNEVWSVVSSARSKDVTKADGGTDETGANDADDEASGGSALTISPGELRLAVVVLLGFVAFGAWTAYNDLTPVNVGVTGAAAVATVMLGGLYAVGSTADEADSSGRLANGIEDGVLIRTEALPPADERGEPEPVSRLEALVDLAESTDATLYRDPDDGTYHVLVADTLYVYDPAGGGDDEASDPGRTRTDGDPVGDGGGGESADVDLATIFGSEGEQ